jgi:hypothetical protein
LEENEDGGVGEQFTCAIDGLAVCYCNPFWIGRSKLNCCASRYISDFVNGNAYIY